MDNPLFGQQLGSYRLVQFLGQGSFAQVYLGQHIHLDTFAAIKILHAQLGLLEEQEFRKEALLLTNLRNQHIIRMLDYGITDGRPFLTMELARKGALSKIHPHKTLVPLPQVAEYTLQIADGLGYAHEQKIVHRDVKPENILVGDHGDLLLGDFGIARLTSTSHASITSTLAGTLAYMSPEQIMGQSIPASDQYALAVMVYEWITGRFPFLGTPPEVIARHLNSPPPPPRQYNPQIPAEVEQVVLTALQKRHENRFSRIQAFANALKQAAQVSQEQLDTVRSSLDAINPAAPTVRDPGSGGAQVAGQQYIYSQPQRTPPPVTTLPGLPRAYATEYWWPTFLLSVEARRAICQGGLPVEQPGVVGPLSAFPSQLVPLPTSHEAVPLSHGSLRDIASFSASALSPSSSANIPSFRLPPASAVNQPVRSTGMAVPAARQTGAQPRVGSTGAQPQVIGSGAQPVVGNMGAQPRVGGARQVRTSGPGGQTGASAISPSGPTPPGQLRARERGSAVSWASISILAFLACVALTIITPSTLSSLSNAQTVLGGSWFMLVISFVANCCALGYSRGWRLRGWMILFLVAEIIMGLVNVSVAGNLHL